MNSLPNGCKCSDVSISPADWKGITQKEWKKGRCKQIWRIHYRFYDPTNTCPDTGGILPYQVRFTADLNRIGDLDERKAAAAAVVKDEWHRLRDLQYNPITGGMVQEVEQEYEIHPDTPMHLALEQARNKLVVVPEMMRDIKSSVKLMDKACKQLRYDTLAIGKVSRRHLVALTDQLRKINPRWSPNRHNKYRSYLIMLFKVLVLVEAVTANPAKDLPKLKTVKRIREILTKEERIAVRKHLEQVKPEFGHFVILFFHSGGRLTELLQQTTKTVDLANQTYKAVIKKRNGYEEVERTIKNNALQHWQFFLDQAKPSEHLFGVGFKPAKAAMKSSTTISRWWQKLIKATPKDGGLGINKDLYSLKHANVSEIVDRLGDEAAAEQAGHTSTAMVVSIYDTHRRRREHERLKQAGNEF